MWIFGYGSLVWKVDFPYVKKVIGYIKGYERKFWQASIDHRGVPEKPGRVVTLVPSSDPEAIVWGIAYEIDDKDTKTIDSLNHREKRFSQVELPFHPSSSSKLTSTPNGSSIQETDAVAGQGTSYRAINVDKTALRTPKSFDVMAYIGDQDGPMYLGEASVQDIAIQIAGAKGPSGANADYIFNLAKFMRSHFPEAKDDHLFDIEKELILLQCQQSSKVWGAAYKIHRADISRVVQHLDHREVMGYEKVPIEFYPTPNHPQNVLEPASPLDYNNVTINIRQSLENHLNGKSLKEFNGVQQQTASIINTANSSNILLVKTDDAARTQEVESELENESDNESNLNDIQSGRRFTVTMYYGSSENEHYLGPSSLESMARQIFESIGPSGKNKEYLYNLAKSMRQICEEALDAHLAELEDAVRDMEIQYNLRSPGTPIEL